MDKKVVRMPDHRQVLEIITDNRPQAGVELCSL